MVKNLTTKPMSKKQEMTHKYKVAMNYYTGQGLMPKNINLAANMFKQSADMGCVDAMVMLGVCYQDGTGVVRNLAKAVEYYQNGVAKGIAEAQYRLGCCYEQGMGVEQNDKMAFKLYQKSAAQKNAQAMGLLGIMYLSGKVVKVNIDKAKKLLMQASKGGSEAARDMLNNWSDYCPEIDNNMRSSNVVSGRESRNNGSKKTKTAGIICIVAAVVILAITFYYQHWVFAWSTPSFETVFNHFSSGTGTTIGLVTLSIVALLFVVGLVCGLVGGGPIGAAVGAVVGAGLGLLIITFSLYMVFASVVLLIVGVVLTVKYR